jgi:hypothetical protein
VLEVSVWVWVPSLLTGFSLIWADLRNSSKDGNPFWILGALELLAPDFFGLGSGWDRSIF